MKFTLLAAAAALPVLAYGGVFTPAQYASGEVHDMIRLAKEASFARHRSAGDHDSRKWRSWDKWSSRPGRGRNDDAVRCTNGLAIVEPGNANQTFRCKDFDFYDFKSHADMGSATGEGSSTWGWTSSNGREFVAVGQTDGTAFMEITRRGKLVYLGRLPQQSIPSIWREIRGYKDYMIIGSEARGHGVQIFDMKKLLSINPSQPRNFSTATDLTGLFTDLPIGRSHNVAINEELNYGVAVGAQPRNSTCRAGLIFFDLSNPAAPTSPGCASADGYTHDAQCLVYRGPDKRYQGRDVCYAYNEDTLTIWDVTNKSGLNASRIISRSPYTGATYTHQGWINDPMNQEFILIDDELDELRGIEPAADGYPVTYIFDIRDLEKPVNTGYYKHLTKSIDHNLFIDEGLAYESNYGAGLHVLDVSGIKEDPTGGNIKEVAFFDIYPEDDALPGGGAVEFVGTWAHYPFFKSGFVFINTIERGGFVVRRSSGRKGRGSHWGN